MLVWCSYGWSYLVIHNQLLLKRLICVQEHSRHPCRSGECYDQWSHKLVKTLVNVDTGSCDVGSCGVFKFKGKLCKVPAFFGTCSGNASKHSWVCPCVDPLAKVPDPYGCPDPVKD